MVSGHPSSGVKCTGTLLLCLRPPCLPWYWMINWSMQWRNFKKYFSESSHVTTCKPLVPLLSCSWPDQPEIVSLQIPSLGPPSPTSRQLGRNHAKSEVNWDTQGFLRHWFPGPGRDQAGTRQGQAGTRQGQVVMCAVISRLNFNSGSEGGCRNLAIITKITLTPCYLFLMTRWVRGWEHYLKCFHWHSV